EMTIDRHSKTNVQVEGIDEGDILKTDGNYIYYSPEYQMTRYSSHSKLILSTWNSNPENIKNVLKVLPDEFLIEIYKCSKDELDEFIKNNLKNIKSPSIENLILTSKKVNTPLNNKSNLNNERILDKYNLIYNYIGPHSYEVSLIPKKYGQDRGIILFNNHEEIFSIYKSNNKIIEGKRALNKIKTIFAVSNFKASFKEITPEKYNEYIETYPKGLLKIFVSFNELVDKIKSKEPIKIINNDSLINILTDEPSLMEIDNNMYIVSHKKEVIYAFFKDYEGDKAYRYIKNHCIFNNVEIKIYSMDNETYKLFREFKGKKVKNN
ncbi:beta-propeller domain-containing protein, partial [Methanothermococcus sp. SCGC AD-155-M21]|nr:beta-propeller domain-containing protein [Methanothermococcus sp. SCGC AD-155-M21]